MTGSQGWGRVTVSFLVWGACVGIVLGTTLLFSQGTGTSAAADNTPSTFIWFADNKTLKQISTATQEVIQSYHLEEKPLALALDPTDKALWVLGKRELLKLDAEVNRPLEIDLKALTQQRSDTQGKDHKGNKHKHDKKEGLEKAEFLALNPYDQSVWIAGEKTLLHLDKDGTLLQSTVLPDKVRAIALSLDETFWVMGERHIWQVQADGSFTEPFDLPETIAAPKNDDNDDHGDRSDEPKSIRFIALDPLGEVLWMANLRHLARINLKDSSDAVIISHDAAQIPPEESEHKGKQEKEHSERKRDHSTLIYDVSVDPQSGTLWLLTEDTLISFDRGGNPDVTIPLPDDVKKPEHLAFDPSGQGLWVSGKGSVGHVDLADNRVTSLAVDKSVEALGVAPFHLVPQLSLIEPADGIHTNNAAPLIRLGLAATCNGTPCDVGETYSSAFQVDASLNGMPVGALFQISDGEALQKPGLKLVDATYALTAQAIDAYGHASNQISAQFTIDTIAPQFGQLQPASGATLNEAKATIQGQVNEAASVVLTHPDGTTTVGTQNFAFAVTLKPGLNSFTLLARDFAGNETRVSLQLNFATISVKIASPGTGTTVNTSSVIVSGNFDGPTNTGITVNGVIAQAFGKQFLAAVSLVPGLNTLEARATSSDGATVTDVVTVTTTIPAGASPDPIHVLASPQSGIAPLMVKFTVSNTSDDPIQKIEIDFDGDGSFDATSTSADTPIEHVYATPGAFQAKSQVTDATGTVHGATHLIVVSRFDDMEQILRGVYTGMLDHLKVGDIDGALTSITGGTRQKYKAIFEALEPNLTTVVDQLGTIERIVISERFAELTVVREKNGGRRAYLVYLLRSEDGVWRIESM
jgi:Glucodextranase, domain B/PKD domain